MSTPLSTDRRWEVDFLKVKPIRYAELIKIVRASRMELLRTKSSHEVWGIGECRTVVPHHPTIAPGTLRSIERQLAPCLGGAWLDGK